jgi:hypothetical protein
MYSNRCFKSYRETAPEKNIRINLRASFFVIGKVFIFSSICCHSSKANLNKECTVIGVSNRIEIWDRETWNDFYEESEDSFEDIAEDLIDPSSFIFR